MRSRLALSLLLTLSSTISCGDKPDPKEPEVERPPRIVVVDVDDPLCDVTLFPEPASVRVAPRTIDVDRVCMPEDTYRVIVGALARWRARAEKYERCERARAAAKRARADLTSADAGVE
jgi:hypothetical protein